MFFSANKFGHMFYESTARDGHLSWDKALRGYDSTRRVAVVYEDFVVVVAIGLKLDGSLKANFVTCYQADNSIGKIRRSPVWSRVDCVRQLGGVV